MRSRRIITEIVARRSKAILLLIACLPAQGTIHAIEALQNVDPPVDYVSFNTDETGFCFRPTTNIAIEALGFAFTIQELPASYVVSVLDHKGEILASATLSTSNTPGSQFIYTNIPPLALAAGSTNFLTCYDAVDSATNGTKSWIGLFVDESDAMGGTFDVAPELDYLTASSGTGPYAVTSNPSLLLVGPNFEFTILQPSRLRISLTATNTVLLSWPAADTLGQLQTAPALGDTMTNVPTPPVVAGTNRVVECQATDSQALFRLEYP